MTFRSKGSSWLNVGMVQRAWMVVVVVLSALWMVSGSATVGFDDDVDTIPWLSPRKSSRFLLQSDWRGGRGQNFCGYGRGPNYGCRSLMPPPEFRNPVCCETRNNDRRCFDVGANNNNRCGTCTTRCRSGLQCCSGVCENLLTSPYNCGRCGNRCRRGVACRRGLCGYNG